MKIRKKFKLLLTVAMTMIGTACGKQNENDNLIGDVRPTYVATDESISGIPQTSPTEGIDAQSGRSIKISFFSCMQKEGMLTWDNLLCVTDYATGEKTPLCNRPNCEHIPASGTNPEPECYAAYKGQIFATFLYQDKLYVFETQDLKHTTVYTSERTGEGRRKICEGNFVMQSYRMFLSDGKLYFTAQEYKFDEAFTGSIDKSFLCIFDAEDNSFYQLTDKTEDQVLMDYVQNGNVYFVQIHNEGTIENGDYQAIFQYLVYEEASDKVKKYLDQESVEKMMFSSDGIYYSVKENTRYVLYRQSYDGKREILRKSGSEISFRIVDDRLLYMQDEKELQKDLSIIGTGGGYYYIIDGRTKSENGGNKRGLIRIEDFWSGTDSIVYVE